MARFRFLGLPPRAGITFGGTVKIRLRHKDGTVTTLDPTPPATEFVVGEDIGSEVLSERTLRALRVDPRFEEI